MLSRSLIAVSCSAAILALIALSAPAAPVSVRVAAPVQGASVRQGQAMTIAWRSSGAPSGSSVTLQLQKAVTGHIAAEIESDLPAEGSISWRAPVFKVQPIMCARDSTGSCGSDINPGTTYRIVATLSAPGPAGGAVLLAQARSAVFKMTPASLRRR